MSSLPLGPFVDRIRKPSVGLMVVAALVLGLVLWEGPYRSAVIGDQLQAFTPHVVTWSGTIIRTFVDGAGAEIASPDAPGGVFHLYSIDDTQLPVTQGQVRIEGSWVGDTCAYGTQCVPEVHLISMQQIAE